MYAGAGAGTGPGYEGVSTGVGVSTAAGRGAAYGPGYNALGVGDFGWHDTSYTGKDQSRQLVGKDRAALQDVRTNIAYQEQSRAFDNALSSGNVQAAMDIAKGYSDVSREYGMSQASINNAKNSTVGLQKLGNVFASMFGMDDEEERDTYNSPMKARKSLVDGPYADEDEDGNVTANKSTILHEILPTVPLAAYGVQALAPTAYDIAPSNVIGYGAGVPAAIASKVAPIDAPGVLSVGYKTMSRADDVFNQFSKAGYGELVAADSSSYDAPTNMPESQQQVGAEQLPLTNIVGNNAMQASAPESGSDRWKRFMSIWGGNSPAYNYTWSLLYPSLSGAV